MRPANWLVLVQFCWTGTGIVRILTGTYCYLSVYHCSSRIGLSLWLFLESLFKFFNGSSLGCDFFNEFKFLFIHVVLDFGIGNFGLFKFYFQFFVLIFESLDFFLQGFLNVPVNLGCFF